MDCLRDLSPTVHLFPGINARRADKPDAHRAHLRTLRNDQAGRGPLGVIGDRERAGDVCPDRPAPGHRGHDHPVLQRKVAERIGCEDALFPGRKRRHRTRCAERADKFWRWFQLLNIGIFGRIIAERVFQGVFIFFSIPSRVSRAMAAYGLFIWTRIFSARTIRSKAFS